jgi:hypothetical protein
MFDVENVGIISSPWICNSREVRLLCERPGRNSKKQRGVVCTVLDTKCLSRMTILRDDIPGNVFNYPVHCHPIKLKLNSVLIFTITVTSQGLFAPLEGSLCLLGAILIVLDAFLAPYFEPSIVYIFSFPMEIPLWQS